MNIEMFFVGFSVTLSVMAWFRSISPRQDKDCDCLYNLKEYPYNELTNTRFEDFVKAMVNLESFASQADIKADIKEISTLMGLQKGEKKSWVKVK